VARFSSRRSHALSLCWRARHSHNNTRACMCPAIICSKSNSPDLELHSSGNCTHACRLSDQQVRSGHCGQITTSCVALCRCAFTIAYSPPQPTHTRTHVCTHFTGATVTTRTLENVSDAAISPRWQNSTRHWRQPRDWSCDRPRAWRSRGSACHLLEDRSARGGCVTQEGWVHCRLHSGLTVPGHAEGH
jgi:hypothetical protein